MTVLTKRFQSEYGFETSGFVVSNGLLQVIGLESNQFAVGGNSESLKVIDGVVTINSKAGPSGSIDNMIIGSTIPANGNFTNLTATISVTLTPSGSVAINPSSVGNINNMNIGLTTPRNAQFVDLTSTNATITNGNVTTLTVTNGTITTFGSTTSTITNLTSTNMNVTNLTANDIIINNQPAGPSYATRKDYVDNTAAALAVALGS